MQLTRDSLLLNLGAARQQSSSAWRLIHIHTPEADEPLQLFLRQTCRRKVRRRERCYLLQTNLVGHAPAQMEEFYTQWVQVEEAFKNPKGDFAIRPNFHQKEKRIDAHIFVYAMQVTLWRRLRHLALGLTPWPLDPLNPVFYRNR